MAGIQGPKAWSPLSRGRTEECVLRQQTETVPGSTAACSHHGAPIAWIELRKIASGRREDAHGGRAQDQSERQDLAGRSEPRHAAPLRARERARAERAAVRLRAGAMRLLL